MELNCRLNETLFLIGGGPSIKQVDLTPLQQIQDRVLVCNNAYKQFPNAYVSHHADFIWWEWHKEQYFNIYKGPNSTTLGLGASRDSYPKQMRRFKRSDWLSDNLHFLYGFCAGMQILNLALILGAKIIILLGYDLKHGPKGETQYHDDHQRETNAKLWQNSMLPEFNRVAEYLRLGGPKVYNANKDSLIRGFEFCDDYKAFI